MISSDIVFDRIEQIAQAKGTNAKQGMLASFGSESVFQLTVRQALNPYITYGVATIPDYTPVGEGREFTDETWRLLDRLSTRELSGNAAKVAIASELAKLTGNSAELLERVLRKDLRAGFGATLANKALPGWVPVFDCMLAHPFDAKRVKVWPVSVEPKLDGFRALGFVDCATSEVRLLTRSGQEYTCFEHLKPVLLELAHKLRPSFLDEGLLVFDGEAVSGDFASTASALRKKGVQCTDVIYHVFDVLPGSVFTSGTASRDYGYRRFVVDMLPTAGPVRQLPAQHAHDPASIHRLYEANRERGLEGVIVKSLDSRYVLKRSFGWMKIKAEDTLDLPVIGAFEGTGKYEGKLGGLIVLNGEVKVSVGSGFTDEQRAALWAQFDLDIQRRRECDDRGENAVDTLLGTLVEVQYHEVTPDGSLRHPRFVRFRGSVEAGKV